MFAERFKVRRLHTLFGPQCVAEYRIGFRPTIVATVFLEELAVPECTQTVFADNRIFMRKETLTNV